MRTRTLASSPPEAERHSVVHECSGGGLMTEHASDGLLSWLQSQQHSSGHSVTSRLPNPGRTESSPTMKTTPCFLSSYWKSAVLSPGPLAARQDLPMRTCMLASPPPEAERHSLVHVYSGGGLMTEHASDGLLSWLQSQQHSSGQTTNNHQNTNPFFFSVRKTAAPWKSPSSEDRHPFDLPNSGAHCHRGSAMRSCRTAALWKSPSSEDRHPFDLPNSGAHHCHKGSTMRSRVMTEHASDGLLNWLQSQLRTSGQTAIGRQKTNAFSFLFAKLRHHGSRHHQRTIILFVCQIPVHIVTVAELRLFKKDSEELDRHKPVALSSCTLPFQAKAPSRKL
eukprot:CAMPEP_0172784588 /NCGR_PEP_ID=MMETSP1074-20121228/205016_1 /TAXON_ID=2916 /ORGANISM="Ceratium fusus, Strain PA161109" /LENGTH=335 /DNA_ID=CAMNT_0013621591 /DNA_START=671 /DNA_END=1678 /DNA_ORIENTATION=+